MSGINIEREKELLRNRLLGRSPELEHVNPGIGLGLDLKLEKTGNGLDLAEAKGIGALSQALRVALTTRLGSDVFNTQFGFDGLNALAEETNSVLMRERIRIAVIQVLRKEPRVRRIIDVKLAGGQLEASPATASGAEDTGAVAPGAGNSRELSVLVAFETINGDQTEIQLGAMGTHG